MVASCCAYNCNVRVDKGGSSVAFHRFPINNERIFRLWCLALRRKDFHPNQHTRICSKHFTEDSYEPCSKPDQKARRLKKNAVPTIFNFGRRAKACCKLQRDAQTVDENSKSNLSDFEPGNSENDKEMETDTGVTDKTFEEHNKTEIIVFKSCLDVKNKTKDTSGENLAYSQDYAEASECDIAETNPMEEDFNQAFDQINNFYEATSSQIKNQQNQIDLLRQTNHHPSRKVEKFKSLTDFLEGKNLISEEAAFVLRSSIDLPDSTNVSYPIDLETGLSRNDEDDISTESDDGNYEIFEQEKKVPEIRIWSSPNDLETGLSRNDEDDISTESDDGNYEIFEQEKKVPEIRILSSFSCLHDNESIEKVNSYEETSAEYSNECAEASKVEEEKETQLNGEDFKEAVDKIKKYCSTTSNQIKNYQNEINVLRQTVFHLSKKIERFNCMTGLLEEKELISEDAAYVLRSSIDMQDSPSAT